MIDYTEEDKEVANINSVFIEENAIRYNKRPIPHTDTINTFDTKRRRLDKDKVKVKDKVKDNSSIFSYLFCCCC